MRKIEKDTSLLERRKSYVYLQNEPEYILIQPVDENDAAMLEEQAEIISSKTTKAFLLAAFDIQNWNNELSPWDAPKVFGNEDFGHGASETLAFIENNLIPDIIDKYGLKKNIPIILGGYSLAAFFSLWCSYQTDTFSAIAAASPSVWFPGWMEYANTHKPKSEYVYLSLGDKEEKTKNKIMATVGDCIRAYHNHLTDADGIKSILEWNDGNHFKDSHIRCAKGFLWCLNNIQNFSSATKE